ncbi:hypothetical protein TrST_g878 [Triparma strigata]|uniref:EF-hand domain-containing protein n=1 Tax=Triparma strigata TaxID=1606541 RepID=A0A9W7EIK8_9STRA|nr:hypothetical protein TrST_g878 [Triparma strigata]
MGASISRRYKYGMRPKKYFKNKVMPEMKETFAILGFSYQHAYTLFKAFMEIDFDNSAEITVVEFHKFLGLKPSRFSERIFGILDLDESGALEFNEFVIGIWNFCTYDALLITKFAFDIFDIDDLGKLQMAECEALIRMVYDEADADPDLMKKIDADNDGEITIDEFADLIRRQPQILQPAFDMQRALRAKCFGAKYWEIATEKRKEDFAGYDSLANSSWESIQKILLIKEKEREEQAKREQEEFVAEAHERMTEHKEKKTEQFSEQQARREKTLARIRSKELPEEKDERENWESFAECKVNMESDCEFSRLAWRIDERQIMWDLIDKLKEMHEVTMNAQEARDLSLAEGPDGDAKAEAYLKTKAGKKKIKFDTTFCYANMIHRNWEKGNALQRVLAPMFKPEVEGQVTYLARFVRRWACGNKGDLDIAYTEAVGTTRSSYHKQERERTIDHYLDLRKQAEQDFKDLVTEVIELFGTRNTRWEKLYDSNAKRGQEYYYYNWKIGKTTACKDGEDPAICEVCDEEIEAVDFKCFNCNTLRSNVNQPKYHGRTPLDQLMEVTYLNAKENDLSALDQKKKDEDEELQMDMEDDEAEGFLGRAMRSTRKFKRSFRKSYGGKKIADIGSSVTRTFRKSIDKG